MGTIVLQEIYHIFMLILCFQIFIGIFLWASSAISNSVDKQHIQSANPLIYCWAANWPD